MKYHTNNAIFHIINHYTILIIIIFMATNCKIINVYHSQSEIRLLQPSCSNKTYFNATTNTCQNCLANCSQCNSSVTCARCQGQLVRYNNKCLKQCPIGTVSINLTCVGCQSYCYSCDFATSNCTSCSSLAVYYNSLCMFECPLGLVIVGSTCSATCSIQCSGCSKRYNNCTSCNQNYYFYNQSYVWRCLLTCPDTFYQTVDNNSIKICRLCSLLTINCSNCNNDTTCISCDLGFIYYPDQTCRKQILSGYANQSGIARKCNIQCLTCLNFAYNCTSCSLYNYYQQQCIQICPISHYALNNVCQRCISPCSTCNNSTSCLSCVTGKYYFNQSCGSNCPIGYYGNNSNYSCLKCQGSCAECYNKIECKNCLINFYLLNKTCVTKQNCPFGSVGINSSCLTCSSPCLSCFDSQQKCMSCPITHFYFQYNYSCLVNCPPTYIIQYLSRICTNCSLPCLICSQDNCYRCSSTHKLYLFKCVLNCPATHYAKQLPLSVNGTQCILCSLPCIECINETYCLRCNNDYWNLGDGQCVKNCPSTHPIPILNLNDNSCKKCSTVGCKNCYISDLCYECNDTSLILFRGECLSECPKNYLYNQTIKTCEYSQQLAKNNTKKQQIIPIVNTPLLIVIPIPFPFSISLVLLSLLALLIKLNFMRVYFFAILSGLIGISESLFIGFGAFIHFQYVRGTLNDNNLAIFDSFTLLILSCFAWLYLINLLTSIFLCFVLNKSDNMFLTWRKKSHPCSILFIFFIQILTLLLNFKLQHLLWSNFHFCPKLSSTSKLRYLSVVSALSMISSLGLTIAYGILLMREPENRLIWIDGIVVIVTNSVVGLLALSRQQNFFQETLYQMPLHKRVICGQEVMYDGLKATIYQQKYQPQGSNSRFKDYSEEISSMRSFRSISKFSKSNDQYVVEEIYQRSRISEDQGIKDKIVKQQDIQVQNISLQCSILDINMGLEQDSKFDYKSNIGNDGSLDQQTVLNQNISLHSPQNLFSEISQHINPSLDQQTVLNQNVSLHSPQNLLSEISQHINPSSITNHQGSISQNDDHQDSKQINYNQESMSSNIHSRNGSNIKHQNNLRSHQHYQNSQNNNIAGSFFPQEQDSQQSQQQQKYNQQKVQFKQYSLKDHHSNSSENQSLSKANAIHSFQSNITVNIQVNANQVTNNGSFSRQVSSSKDHYDVKEQQIVQIQQIQQIQQIKQIHEKQISQNSKAVANHSFSSNFKDDNFELVKREETNKKSEWLISDLIQSINVQNLLTEQNKKSEKKVNLDTKFQQIQRLEIQKCNDKDQCLERQRKQQQSPLYNHSISSICDQSNKQKEYHDQSLCILQNLIKQSSFNIIKEEEEIIQQSSKKQQSYSLYKYQEISNKSQIQPNNIRNQHIINEEIPLHLTQEKLKQKQSDFKDKQKDIKDKINDFGNEFQIKTKKHKKQEKNKVLYVDATKYRSLKKQSRILDQQQRRGSKISQSYNQQFEQKRKIRMTNLNDKLINTKEVLEKVYLKKSFSPKRTPPKKSKQQKQIHQHQ